MPYARAPVTAPLCISCTPGKKRTQSARTRASIRHRVLAPVPGQLSSLEFLLDRRNRVADFLHCCFQPILRNAKFLGPVTYLVVLIGIDAGAVLHSLLDRSSLIGALRSLRPSPAAPRASTNRSHQHPRKIRCSRSDHHCPST